MDPQFSENMTFGEKPPVGGSATEEPISSLSASTAEPNFNTNTNGHQSKQEMEGNSGFSMTEKFSGVDQEAYVRPIEQAQLAYLQPPSIQYSTNNAQLPTTSDATDEPSASTATESAPHPIPLSASTIMPRYPTDNNGVPDTPVINAPPNSAIDAIPSGVDFQALLDTLTPHSHIIAQAEPTQRDDNVSSAGPQSVVPQNANVSLPPRPPPQEKPAIHPNYAPGDDIRAYHPHSQQDAAASYRAQNAVPPAFMTTGANGLPPPPAASFQQGLTPSLPLQSPSTQVYPGAITDDEDAPFPPDVERQFDEFLHDERVNVTEGNWDKFPDGSRLFIGNLPTEKVSKRDVFRRFYRYGKLAQISLKQAYGFVQFTESHSCKMALDAEQNALMRGRKMHLEISKPQNKSGGRDRERGPRRRSRSPEQHGRGGRGDRGDRYGSAISPRDREFRRGRDDYRPGRSPSPRSYRRGGRSPDRYDGRRRSRSRSPYDRNRGYRDRRTEEDDLPLPRRAPRDVPDAQIIVLDDLDRNFIAYVEKVFKDRGLRCDVLLLSPRLSEAAVVRRQILEGVLAVVRLTKANLATGRLSLQLFDRRAGADNVKFEQYEDLEPHITTELVIRAKQTHMAPAPAQAAYGLPAHNNSYGMPQNYGIPQQPSQPAADPLSGLLATLGSRPELQGLLAGLQQQQQQPGAPPVSLNPDLARLLAGMGAPQPQQQQQQQQQQGYPQQAHAPPPQMASNPALASLLGQVGAPAASYANAPPGQGHSAPAQQPDMQEIMAQLAKYQR